MTRDRHDAALRIRPHPTRSSSRALSIIVPVHQGAEHLRSVLVALTQRTLARDDWELIVVDDASTDGSAEIAAEYADMVIRLTGRPRGPAYARNRAFEVSRGSFIAFVDADVLVHSQALPRMIELISQDPSIGAVIGSYDAGRTSGKLVSDYRNLLRYAEHQSNAGDTDTFAAGLALVRAEAFANAGMFDEWRFPRPLVEALELGDRLRALNYRILRLSDAEATHLKRWTIRNWIWDDLLDRGVSVARLNQLPDFRARAERLYLASPSDAALSWAAATGAVVGIWQESALIALCGAVSLIALVLHNGRLFTLLARVRGVAFAIASIPLHLIACATYGMASAVGRMLYHAVGEPQPDPVVQAFAEVGLRAWPPMPTPRGASIDALHARRNGTTDDP